MKIAVLSESSADEAGIRVLSDGILGIESIPPTPPPLLRTRGCPSISLILPTVIASLHFNTDADGLVFNDGEAKVDARMKKAHKAYHSTGGHGPALNTSFK